MKARIHRLWEKVRDSFWFVPSLMTLAAMLLSWFTLRLDRNVDPEVIRGIDWIYITGTAGSREILATIAGSMMTVTGVVFSVTTVALSLASQQLGPRLLRNFMSDKGNQIVLGTFIATFLYCLLVLRTIHETDEETFVPRLSLACAVGLALTNLGVLIYFIHHVAVAIQAPTVIESVGRSFVSAVESHYPAETGKRGAQNLQTPCEDALPRDFEERATAVASPAAGYLQALDGDALVNLAEKHDLFMRVETRPGRFILRGEPFVRVYPQERVNETIRRRINLAFVLGGHRTPTQDVEFALDQLVEVAVRALSPGVNDPFTALSCIDWMTAGLRELAQQKSPSNARADSAGTLRLVTPSASFEGLMAAAYNQLRQNARLNVAVTCRLLESIHHLLDACREPQFLDVLAQHAAAIHRNAEAWPEELDKQDAGKRYRAVQEQLIRVRQQST